MKSKLILIPTANMARSEWLAERRKTIGGSDTASILGLNPYATPYTVWADKTGRLPEKEDSEAMRQGRDLEQYVADRFTEVCGKKTRKVNAIIKNPDFPWASANIDRDIVGEDSGLECKTTSILNLKKFRNGEFPENYYTQSVHYMAITEYSRWYLAVLILNRGFLVYQLTRVPDDTVPGWCESSVYVSDDEISALMGVEQEFWSYVEKDTPPELSGSQADSDALQAIYKGGGAEVPADLSGQADTLRRYLALKDRIKDLETELSACEQQIKAGMGDDEAGQAFDISVLWKPQTRRTFDVKQFAKDNPEIDLSPYYKSSSFRRFSATKMEEKVS